jgi:hypothetical protein
MVVLCVVSFVKVSPRRSCTALSDVGPRETFSACLQALGFDEAGLFWFVALGFNEAKLFQVRYLLAMCLWCLQCVSGPPRVDLQWQSQSWRQR